MEYISKYLFRTGGFLLAMQIFVVFAMTGEHLGSNLARAAVLAMVPVPFFIVAGLMTSVNALREAGTTILLWAGGGCVMFFGSIYGDPNRDRITLVPIPQASELNLGLGFTNLALIVLAAIAMWVWGVMREPPPGNYHGAAAR